MSMKPKHLKRKLKIDKGLPIPSKQHRRDFLLATIREMRKGDSVLVKNRAECLSITNVMRRHGVKFTARKMDEGVRVWKV